MTGTILIVDDVATNRILLKVRLAAACYRTEQAASGAEAVTMARQSLPDLILLDYCLPDMDGVAVLRTLRADPATAAIPVVFFTGRRDAEARQAALRAGADGFLVKPFEERLLLARIRSLLRDRNLGEGLREQAATIHELALQDMALCEPAARFEAAARIALIATRAEVTSCWRAALSGYSRDQLIPMTREEALADTALTPAPDLYVIAADLDGGQSGLTLMSDLRSRARSRDAAICIVLSEDGGEAAAMALDLGAGDVLGAGFDPEEAALRLRVLLRRKRAVDAERTALQRGLALATKDPLTGLYNRRYAFPAFARVLAEGRSAGLRMAVMVIDIDRFKSVNDRFGHATGDMVLVEVARRLTAMLPSDALVARIGGEEFLVALPDAPEPAARAMAEQICDGMAARPVVSPAGPGEAAPLWLSVSIGLALDTATEGEAPDALIARADRALLNAKAEGRNQVTMGRTAA